MRSFGPGRSWRIATGRPTRPAALRTRWAVSACCSAVPCEKFSRATSMPAATIRSSVLGSREAGPIVATIFVWRCTCRAYSARDVRPVTATGSSADSLAAMARSERRRSSAAVRTIPPGHVTTYGDLCPGAPRRAGAVLAANADPELPWQRVVRADGSLAKGDRQRRAARGRGCAVSRRAGGHAHGLGAGRAPPDPRAATRADADVSDPRTPPSVSSARPSSASGSAPAQRLPGREIHRHREPPPADAWRRRASRPARISSTAPK